MVRKRKEGVKMSTIFQVVAVASVIVLGGLCLDVQFNQAKITLFIAKKLF